MQKFCLILILLVLFCYWLDLFEDRDPTTLYDDILRHIDALLDDALHLSLSGFHEDDGFQVRLPASLKSDTTLPLAAPILVATAKARLCQSLQGRTIHLVGPRETLYQLHTYLLKVLHPHTTRVSCPGPLSCPFHALCHTLSRTPGSSSGPLTAADVVSTNTSLMRFVYSSTLHPSSIRDDPRFRLPFMDPRTDVRVVDSRWVTQAASRRKNGSDADILVLNRAPLPAPAWSYNASRGDWTWLLTLRDLEKEHAEPLARHLFADVLSHLDYFPTEPDSRGLMLLGAALHSTVSTFLPSLLENLENLREHAGHRAILEVKPVLWYGSWFQPVSCAPDHVSALLSSEPDPRRLLLRLLAQAEAIDNPWNAYYNAQGLAFIYLSTEAILPELVTPVYMHERLLAKLLPKYGILYISSLSMVIPAEAGRTYKQGDCPRCASHLESYH